MTEKDFYSSAILRSARGAALLTLPRPHAKGLARGRPFVDVEGKTASVARGDRTAPAEAVVQAGLDGVLVVAKAGADDFGRSAGEGGAAEIVILIFELGRPVLGQHVFEAGANRIAVLAVACRRERHPGAREGNAEVRAVAPGITALGVKQGRTLGVAEAAGHRAELVGAAGYPRTGREHDSRIVAAEPAILGFGAEHPIGRELIVVAALHAAEETAVAAFEAAVAGKRAADVTADIKSGPVVDQLRRRIGWRLGVGARRQIGGQCRPCEGDRRSGAK